MNIPLPSDRESEARAVATERLEMLARLECSGVLGFAKTRIAPANAL